MGFDLKLRSFFKVHAWKLISLVLFSIYYCVAFSGTIECQKTSNLGKCLAADGNTSIYRIGNDSTVILGEPTDRTTIWVSSVLDSVFNLVAPNDSIPHDSISYINNSNPFLDVSVNTSSIRNGYDSGDTTIISSLVNDLSLISDGKNGTAGLSSSELCAKSFSGGSLGLEAKNYWGSRGSNLDPNKCIAADIQYANGLFKCPDEYTLNNNTPVDVVDLSKVISKRRCSAQINQQICIGRTADLKCTTNTLSNVCCNDPNIKWDKLGSYYNQSHQGSTCDPAKCVINTIDDQNNLSGSVDFFKIRIFEKQFLQAGSNVKTACEEEINKKRKPMQISWSVGPFLDPELGREIYHPGNIKIIERISNSNTFTIPVIDNIESINGDDTSPNSLRYYLEDIDQGNVANVNINGNTNAFCDPALPLSAGVSPCGNRIKNCLGLNGTNPWKLTCERTPGPPFKIGIGLIDKFGNKSNKLILQIPEGRFGWYFVMESPTHQVGCGIFGSCSNVYPIYGRYIDFYTDAYHDTSFGGIPWSRTWPHTYPDLTTMGTKDAHTVTVQLPWDWNRDAPDGEYRAKSAPLTLCSAPGQYPKFCRKTLPPQKYYY